MAKEMPTCAKCEKQHWGFQDCSEGKVFKQMGYDSIKHGSGYGRDSYGGRFKRETGYARLQKRQQRRAVYHDDLPPAA